MAKLSANRVAAYLAKPDAAHRAMLLYGPDPTLVTDRREALVRVMLGADDDPFRLVRLTADAAKRDPVTILDECNAISFGGGDRVVVLAGAMDALAAPIGAALDGMAEGATLVVTADTLSPGSKLRKLFEGAEAAIALPCYAAEGAALADAVTSEIARLGAPPLDGEARSALLGVLDGLQHGEARRFAEVLALRCAGSKAVTAADIAACAPPAAEADFDEGVQAIAQGRARALPALFDRFEAQGASLPGLVRVVSLYLARLHRAQAIMAAEGIDAAAASGKLRPPVFWKTRDAFSAQLRAWPQSALEEALAQLSTLEASLRSGKTLPERAVIERALMRIAITAPRRAG